MLGLFVFMIVIGQSSKDNLGAAMMVGGITSAFVSVPIALLVAIAARGGLHLHLHKHEQPRQLREPIDVDAKMIEGPTQVTVRKE